MDGFPRVTPTGRRGPRLPPIRACPTFLPKLCCLYSAPGGIRFSCSEGCQLRTNLGRDREGQAAPPRPAGKRDVVSPEGLARGHPGGRPHKVRKGSCVLPGGPRWGSRPVLALGKLVPPAAWKGVSAHRAPLATSHVVGHELHDQRVLLQTQEPRVALGHRSHQLAPPRPERAAPRQSLLCSGWSSSARNSNRRFPEAPACCFGKSVPSDDKGC